MMALQDMSKLTPRQLQELKESLHSPMAWWSARYQIGEDVFVREPKRFIPGATCIVGRIYERHWGHWGHGTWFYRIRASVGGLSESLSLDLAYRERDIGPRPGTPLNELSGRPGFPGYDRFKQIASSYGYD